MKQAEECHLPTKIVRISNIGSEFCWLYASVNDRLFMDEHSSKQELGSWMDERHFVPCVLRRKRG